jgi:two-component system, sensor histidine kinase
MTSSDTNAPASALLRSLARASHDLRQPFSSSAIFLHLLEQELTTPRQRQIAGRLRESVESARDLLNALLDLSAIESGRVVPVPAPVSLEDLLLRVAEAFAGTADGRGLRFAYVPTSAWVSSDAALLERTVRALVANAMAFTPVAPGRGRVVLGVRHRGDRAAIQVWDDGPGITPDHQDRIFEPFERLETARHDRSRGLGLGLTLGRRTADLLGHRLSLRSWSGRGSVFEVEAPAIRFRHRDVTPTDDGLAVAQRPLLVLLEDDMLQRLALEDLLTGWGWDCVPSIGVDAALAAIRDRGTAPAAVIADLNLGGRERGDGAIGRIRGIFGPSVRGVVVTGDTDEQLRLRLVAAGIAVVHKPVEPAALRAALGAMTPPGPVVRASDG